MPAPTVLFSAQWFSENFLSISMGAVGAVAAFFTVKHSVKDLRKDVDINADDIESANKSIVKLYEKQDDFRRDILKSTNDIVLEIRQNIKAIEESQNLMRLDQMESRTNQKAWLSFNKNTLSRIESQISDLKSKIESK